MSSQEVRCSLLPPELIDVIIDAVKDLAKDDESYMQTLHTFSLVSKACVPRCRRYIFQAVAFCTDAGEDALAERYQQFLSILRSDPRVESYVERLVLRDIEMPTDGIPPWMITNAQFHQSLLRMAPNLKRFTFIAEDYAWSSFPVTLKHTFFAIFSSPVLKFLRIQGLEATPRACSVAFSANVVDLTIIRSSFLNIEDPDLPSLAQSCIPTKLYWLGLEDVDDDSVRTLLKTWTPTTAPGQDHLFFPALTALSIGPTEEDAVAPLWELALAAKDMLQYFYWDYCHGTQARPLRTSPLNMSLLPRLFAIEYEVTYYVDDEIVPDPPDHFDGLLALLRTVTPGAIQQIGIKVDYQDLDEALESLQEYDGWKQLETLLVSEPFNELHQVNLQIELETVSREDRMDIDNELEELKEIREDIGVFLNSRLPLLSNMDGFSFKFIVTH